MCDKYTDGCERMKTDASAAAWSYVQYKNKNII